MVIALCILLTGIQAAIYLVNDFDKHNSFDGSAIGWIVCILPLVFAGFLVVQFLLKKSKSKMVMACQAVLVSELMTCIWFLIDYYVVHNGAIN